MTALSSVYDGLLRDISQATDAALQVLKLYGTAGQTRSKLQERLGKAENDYKNLAKKYERAEEKIREKDKKIGEIENNLLKIKDMNKAVTGKKPGISGPLISSASTEDNSKTKIKSQGAGLFEHEIKKKDLEIYKLKDAVKRSIILQKDKVDINAGSKFSRFEVNNFYDGLEKDFNLLDSRKTIVYKLMVDEGSELRELVMTMFDDLANISHQLANQKEVSIKALTSQLHVRQQQNPSSKLSWDTLNQPLHSVKAEVKRCITDRLNELRKMLGLKAASQSTA